MAHFLSSTIVAPPCSKPRDSSILQFEDRSQSRQRIIITNCQSGENNGLPAKGSKLEVGSPVIVIEAPRMIKTATSIPCLRVNSGMVKQGDVGRIVSRKPKDVWAVRLTVGTYLIDGKYFKPLELDE